MLGEAEGQFIDLVGAESAPVLPGVCNADGCLGVAERFDLLQRLPILSHVDHAVFDSLGVETAVRSVALDTTGLGVNGNQNDSL